MNSTDLLTVVAMAALGYVAFKVFKPSTAAGQTAFNPRSPQEIALNSSFGMTVGTDGCYPLLSSSGA